MSDSGYDGPPSGPTGDEPGRPSTGWPKGRTQWLIGTIVLFGGGALLGHLLGSIVLGLIIAFTAIAVVNTLVMATSARRREFAALRLVGAGR